GAVVKLRRATRPSVALFIPPKLYPVWSRISSSLLRSFPDRRLMPLPAHSTYPNFLVDRVKGKLDCRPYRGGGEGNAKRLVEAASLAFSNRSNILTIRRPAPAREFEVIIMVEVVAE